MKKRSKLTIITITKHSYHNLQKLDQTFNQMLAKYGYIEDESNSKKERKREWHVKKVKHFDDSDDSDD